MTISKEVYKNIIKNFHNKDINAILNYFKNYNPKYIKSSVIRLIIKNTLNFDLAIELNDANNINTIKTIITRVFLLDFINIETKILSKKDINLFNKDHLYLKFKPLFLKQLDIYNSCYYYYIHNEIVEKKNNYYQQSLDQMYFNLSFHKNKQILLDLLESNKVYFKNLFITKEKIIIKNSHYNKPKIYQDIVLENMLLYYILKMK